MTISVRSASANPSDGGTLYDAGPSAIIFPTPAGTVTGDLIEFTVARRGTLDITMSGTGGQSWTAGTLRQTGSHSVKKFWCRFNGTWVGNVTIATLATANLSVQGTMIAIIPTTGTNTWAIDVAETFATFNAPSGTPFGVSITGRTTLAASTITIATYSSLDKNTWALEAGSWANAGNAQYRQVDSSGASRNLSLSHAYLVRTSAGATGNVTNDQVTLGGDAGLKLITTYKEQSSGVTVASVGADTRAHDGESVTISCTSAGASQGAGSVLVSPTDNVADGSAIAATITGWADTSITATLNLSSFAYDTNLYVFVKNNGGSSNAAGFVIQREARLNITLTLKTLVGVAQASKSNIRYRVCPTTINGTPLLSGTTETTDGSGVITIGTYTLVASDVIAPGDDVWLTVAIDGVSAALSPASTAKVSPTYS